MFMHFLPFLVFIVEGYLILYNVIALTALVTRIDCIDLSCMLLCFHTLDLKYSFVLYFFPCILRLFTVHFELRFLCI